MPDDNMPVLYGYSREDDALRDRYNLLQVPMRILNEEMAQRIHGQSLQRLAEPGGMSPLEIMININKARMTISDEAAVLAIREHLRNLQEGVGDTTHV